MISSVRGPVLFVGATSAVVEVGGVGLSLTITPSHASTLRVGAEALLLTALIVKEDDLALFGFADPEQLRVFDLLRGVTGVGPKSAMGVLSTMSPDDVAHAVNDDDDAAFRKVSGIGPKTAKLIVVSLTGKMHVVRQRSASSSGMNDARTSVVEALLGLGWNERAAVKAAADALESVDPAQAGSVQAILRVALTTLGPSQGHARTESR
jgi:Holliday junction DNA helicase RuvA